MNKTMIFWQTENNSENVTEVQMSTQWPCSTIAIVIEARLNNWVCNQNIYALLSRPAIIGGGSIRKVGRPDLTCECERWGLRRVSGEEGVPLPRIFFSFQSAKSVFWGTRAQFSDINIHY